jgi:hypothetical protein
MGTMNKLEEPSFQLLGAYHEAGGNFIDTARKMTFGIYQGAWNVMRRDFEVCCLPVRDIPNLTLPQ